ncbi:response regulator [Marinobacterium jannaschii]|uniref:response regulator n=1 Tax=Marinobacterium jannaschii TaxID=64970 RepID=UPI000AC376F8|nr:response regulator [Marinobacterium jannaschii]
MEVRPIEILLVEDNPGDIELVKAGFDEARVANNIVVIGDGQDALDFFDQAETLPDIVLLDINLPKVDGIEVLHKIKSQPRTRSVPVIILTSSEAEIDISRSYTENANSYITKPVDFEKFIEAIRSLEDFWLSVVKLPGQPG